MERRILKVKEKIKFKKPSKKVMIIAAVCVVLAIAVGIFAATRKGGSQDAERVQNTVKVTKGSIVNVVEASGVLEANEQYDITALVSGDIVADYFSEGDMVTKDQVLYQIDSATIEKNIEKSNNSLTQAQLSYNEAIKSLEDLSCPATESGTITEMYVRVGDKVSNGTKICDIVNNTTMTLSLPFLASEASGMYIGQSASVQIIGDSNTYGGTVTFISGGSQTNSYGVAIKNVEIDVRNPGGINSSDTATAIVGGVACAAPGTFEYAANVTVTAEVSGTIKSINFIEGDTVTKGSSILKIENESVQNQVTKAALSLKDAQLSLDNLKDDLEQYSIKAPIDGKIIQKNTKAGDKLGQSSGSATSAMAVIADMSKFKLTINIDELEVSSLQVGQKATITADAVEGQVFEGVVNNISIIGTSQNGVTTYPVEIVIEDVEDTALIPGMNVDAVITIEEKNDILMLPLEAVNRGNTVTVNGKKVKVEIGINNGTMVEIVSGLSEGDEVTYESVAAAPQSDEESAFGGMMGGGNMGGGMPGGGNMGTMPGGGGNMGGGAPGGGGMMR